jgi:DNA-binding MarR family transcriptional regulator
MATKSLVEKLNIDLIRLTAYGTGLLQGKAYSRLNDKLTQSLLPFGISIPEWKLLGQLHEHGKMRLAELADKLSYDPPMVTKLAKKLEKKGLSKRVADAKDERAKVISITVKGDTLVKNIEPEVKKAMRSILKGITPDELRSYLKVLSTIVQNTN